MDLLTQIEELKEPEFHAPIGVWEDFMEGHIWMDIQRELSVWLSDTWRLLEVEKDLAAIHELQGRARTIREFLDIPRNIITMIETKEDSYAE